MGFNGLWAKPGRGWLALFDHHQEKKKVKN